MRDIALQVARESKDRKINALREYLQNYLLFLMQKTKMSESLYFVGGTALRFLYRIRCYDLPSAFAGKLAAIMQRSYTKGRDIFDYFWFRSHWHGLVPNLTLLNNALTQQGSEFDPLNEKTWLTAVRDKIESLDWAKVVADVRPFLESEDDLTAFTRDALLTLLE